MEQEHVDDCLDLWRAVLSLAMSDYHNGSAEHGVSYQADACRWFESNEQYIGSFCWVCQQLRLDHRAVREAIADRATNEGARDKRFGSEALGDERDRWVDEEVFG